MASHPMRTITARVPLTLHSAVATLAEQRSESLNKFVEQVLAREVAEQEQKALYDAFTLLGRDIEESDVDFARDAQAEVALGA